MKLIKLTKKIKEMHYELWDWCVKNPSMNKMDHPNWVWNDGKWGYVMNECFLCEIYINSVKNRPRCPLKKANGVICADKASWYQRWASAKTPKTRIKYATLIRDIFKEGGK